MICERCGCEFPREAGKCPNCNLTVHYGGGGKTDFFDNTLKSKLSISDLFSGAFKSHPAGAGDSMFMAGTALSTPTPDKMLTEWEKPWLFTRVIGIGILFTLLSRFLDIMWGNQNEPLGQLLILFIGTLIIPLGVLIFYWEINIPRDIPIYKVLVIFFIGGLLSLIFTILLGKFRFLGGAPYLAPLTEEPAKIIALAIFVYRINPKYIFVALSHLEYSRFLMQIPLL